MKTIITAAIARNGVIGRTTQPCKCAERTSAYDPHAHWDCQGTYREPANGIPWYYPEDMKHFRDTTMGHAVVMGRRTWESLPEKHRPLKGRTNIVISSTLPYEERPTRASFGDLSAAIEWAQEMQDVYIIGGAQLYAAALPLADELDLTLIDRDFEGNVKFPGRTFHPGDDEAPGALFGDGYAFECVERRQGETPELTFTRWVRR